MLLLQFAVAAPNVDAKFAAIGAASVAVAIVVAFACVITGVITIAAPSWRLQFASATDLCRHCWHYRYHGCI